MALIEESVALIEKRQNGSFYAIKNRFFNFKIDILFHMKPTKVLLGWKCLAHIHLKTNNKKFMKTGSEI